jgi:phage baseplate assembly protein W
MAQTDALIGSGFQFPIRVNERGGLNWSAGPQRIQDAVWLILATAPGERLMRPAFGAGVDDFVFEPNDAASRTRLATAIAHALTRDEPRIELTGVTVEEVPDGPSAVLVRVEYRIRSTNELHNLVYPLYLQEGLG